MAQVLIVGTIVDGITVYGPLQDKHTLDWILYNFGDDDWVVADLHFPGRQEEEN